MIGRRKGRKGQKTKKKRKEKEREREREEGKVDTQSSDVKNNLTISVACLLNFKLHSFLFFPIKWSKYKTET